MTGVSTMAPGLCSRQSIRQLMSPLCNSAWMPQNLFHGITTWDAHCAHCGSTASSYWGLVTWSIRCLKWSGTSMPGHMIGLRDSMTLLLTWYKPTRRNAYLTTEHWVRTRLYLSRPRILDIIGPCSTYWGADSPATNSR